MLVINQLESGYGEVPVLRGVSLTVHQGELVSLVGPNGAGKTTLLRTVSGLIKPWRGSITFLGQRIDGREAPDVCRLGLIQVPEGRALFPNMTVQENLEMGAYLPGARRALRESMDLVFQRFPILKQRRRHPCFGQPPLVKSQPRRRLAAEIRGGRDVRGHLDVRMVAQEPIQPAVMVDVRVRDDDLLYIRRRDPQLAQAGHERRLAVIGVGPHVDEGQPTAEDDVGVHGAYGIRRRHLKACDSVRQPRRRCPAVLTRRGRMRFRHPWEPPRKLRAMTIF
ncbi:MAG: ATP-binding cassette domain-containing protein [Limnochordales bacterium]